LRFTAGIAYQVPDLDGVVRIYINNTQGQQLACVEAELSNGKSVDQPAVGWITAVIAGLGLIASAVTSGLGHSNTAAHVAANALSLFGYFQAQAMIGMTSTFTPHRSILDTELRLEYGDYKSPIHAKSHNVVRRIDWRDTHESSKRTVNRVCRNPEAIG